MAKWAIVFGLLLVALGLWGYLGHDASNPGSASAEVAPGSPDQEPAQLQESTGPSKTALIPAGFGILMLLCGALGLDHRMRKHAMHGAAGIALLGLIASAGRIASKFSNLVAGDISRPMMFVMLMGMICLVFLIMAVRSFAAARKA